MHEEPPHLHLEPLKLEPEKLLHQEEDEEEQKKELLEEKHQEPAKPEQSPQEPKVFSEVNPTLSMIPEIARRLLPGDYQVPVH